MSLVVRCEYAEAKQYDGVSVTAKFMGKKHPLYFRVTCDGLNVEDAIALARRNPSILMLEYEGDVLCEEWNKLTKELVGGVYIGHFYESGNNITRDDVAEICNSVPSGVVPVINLPDDFKNLKLIYEMCKTHERVRFDGGILFPIEGVRIGCCGKDILDNRGIKYSSSLFGGDSFDCELPVVQLDELEIEVSKKAVKSKVSGDSHRGTPKKKLLFSNLLYQSGKVEL